MTAHPILFLPPNEQIQDVLDISPAFHLKYPEPIFAGSVTYKDLDGNEFKETFRIDLTYLKKRIYIRESSLIDELERLNDTMASIVRYLHEKEERPHED